MFLGIGSLVLLLDPGTVNDFGIFWEYGTFIPSVFFFNTREFVYAILNVVRYEKKKKKTILNAYFTQTSPLLNAPHGKQGQQVKAGTRFELKIFWF